MYSDKIFPHINKEDLILHLLEDSEAEAEDNCSDISINSEERGTVFLQILTDLFINAFASRWIEKYLSELNTIFGVGAQHSVLMCLELLIVLQVIDLNYFHYLVLTGKIIHWS